MFITIDDGFTTDPKLTELLALNKVPVTSFLTRDAVQDRRNYFKALSESDGQTVQNHTISHPFLTKASVADQQRQICETSESFGQWFGSGPWMLRPPYGDYNRATQEAAKECGIDYVVLWNVSLPMAHLRYGKSDHLNPGDIILTHYRPNLYKHLAAAFRNIKRQGFKVAALQDYLPKR